MPPLDLNIPFAMEEPQPSVNDTSLLLTLGSAGRLVDKQTKEGNPGISPFSFLSLGVVASPPWKTPAAPAAPTHCSTSPSPPPATAALRQPEMANFPVDLSPFVPGHFEILEVPHRPQQCRYHVASPVSAKHEDLTIATITPGPLLTSRSRRPGYFSELLLKRSCTSLWTSLRDALLALLM
jgi:hypothetical protein